MGKSLRVNVEEEKTLESLRLISIGRILEHIRDLKLDIVHNHLDWPLFPFSSFIPYPVVSTLHGFLGFNFHKLVYESYAKANYISISNNQRKPMPELNYVGTVYNGINVKKFSFSYQKGSYFAFLARANRQKGPVQAIEMAKAAGVTLKIAAKIDPLDKEFFDREVKHLIDGKQIQYVGEIGPNQKSDFLKNALALLAPIQWDEPFGLYFVESMACGTPVISFARGSAPEIIKHEVTGFLSEPGDNRTFIEYIKKIANMPEVEYAKMRQECRKHVEDNFSSRLMAINYEKIYHQIINESLKKS